MIEFRGFTYDIWDMLNPHRKKRLAILCVFRVVGNIRASQLGLELFCDYMEALRGASIEHEEV